VPTRLCCTGQVTLLVACLNAMTACSRSDAASENAASNPAAQWRRLSDGSYGRHNAIRTDDGTVSEGADRCWPREGAYDCVSVGAIGITISAHRYHVAHFEDDEPAASSEQNQMAIEAGTSLPERVVRGGYSCFREGDSIHETIFRGPAYETTLASNSVDLAEWASKVPPDTPFWRLPDTGLWSREYVEGYLRANSIPADRPYLNCLSVTQLVREGNASTINTAALSYSVLTGYDDPSTPVAKSPTQQR
jgi:hypothetical protein